MTCSARPRDSYRQNWKIDVQDVRALRAALACNVTGYIGRRADKLKMVCISSDRTTTYLAAIKPFVDAVNAESHRI